MKPTSIIFLIISVVIVIAGTVLCTVGVNIAKEQDVNLFMTDVSVVNGDVVRSVTLDEETINKVVINIDGADIYIKPSPTGESYLEFYNFQIGTYDFSVQNKKLLVNNETSIFSLMHIAEGNFSFSGLRHYLTYKPTENTKKTLYIYLSDELTAKAFDITCEDGNVYLDGLGFNADYDLAVKDGSLAVTALSTKSMIQVSVTNGTARLDNISCRKSNILIEKGMADLYFSNVPLELTVDVAEGDIYTGFKTEAAYGMEFNLAASRNVIYNGTVTEDNPYIASGGPGGSKLNMNASGGSVSVQLAASGVTHLGDSAFEKSASSNTEAKETDSVSG